MKRAQTSLSIHDISRALEASEGITTVLLEVLYASGGRVSEIVGLTWGDVNLEGRTVRLQGKGGDERAVPLGKPCVEALSALLDGRRATVAPTEKVFPGLTTQNVRDRLKVLGRRIGVHLHPHAFRHAFSSHLHLNGANERVIQELLGHRRVDTTAIYLQGCERALQEKRELITRCLANARGRGEDMRGLRRVIGGGLALR